MPLEDEDEYIAPRRSRRDRRQKKKRGRSFLAVVMSLVVIGGIAFAAYSFGRDALSNVTGFFGDPEDYPGPGQGEVVVEIEPGTSLSGIGDVLYEANVVASSEAFVAAAGTESLQAGTYTLKEQMKAEDAVQAMIDGTTILDKVTVPEGLRVSQIIDRIVEETDFKKKHLQAAVDNLELPGYADGNPEGLLFPATYEVVADTNAESLIQNMFERFQVAAEELKLERNAQDIGLTPHEALTLASIVQREVRNIEDMPGVAEVIYNRLNDKCKEVAKVEGGRRLQMDSTVHYALNEYGDVATTDAQRQTDSPYNTYIVGGLPPGPIASPGEDALNAVFDPTEKGWCYFRTVDLESGETKFSKTSEDHNN